LSDSDKIMFEIFLEGLVWGLLRLVVVVLLFPVGLVVATPIILLRAVFLAVRGEWKFGHAVADGYDTLWTFWWVWW